MHFSWKSLLSTGILLCLISVAGESAADPGEIGETFDIPDEDVLMIEVPTEEPAEKPDNTSYSPRFLQVSSLYAGGITWTEIINNLLTVLAYTIFYVATSAFLLGALMYTAGFINEEYKSKGKNLMIGSLTGMALVLAARAIFNAAYFFVYGI